VGAKESVSDPMSFVMPNQFVLVLWVRGSNARKFQVDYESEIPRKVVRKLKLLVGLVGLVGIGIACGVIGRVKS
jgi:hypothetical protein